ncbi:hypothetical protein SEA_PABST_40 [Microbacterium phage Pabst]|nr:hypothetical protein SEA_PABST_40 [Microbacterium phage Pabst]
MNDTATPTFFESAKKAFTAGAIGVLGAFGPAFLVATGDGIITLEETLPIAVISLGVGVAAFCGTYAVRNAPVA